MCEIFTKLEKQQAFIIDNLVDCKLWQPFNNCRTDMIVHKRPHFSAMHALKDRGWRESVMSKKVLKSLKIHIHFLTYFLKMWY